MTCDGPRSAFARPPCPPRSWSAPGSSHDPERGIGRTHPASPRRALRALERLHLPRRMRGPRPRRVLLHDGLDGTGGLDRPRSRPRPARPARARPRRRRQRAHEPGCARLDRRRGASEPPPRLLRQRRPCLDGRAGDSLGPSAAGRAGARRRLPLGGARREPCRALLPGRGVPDAGGTRLPARAHRARSTRTSRPARAARSGGDDLPAPPRPGGRAMILLNPGPVNVSPRVRAALLRDDLCHREPECEELLARIRDRLLSAFVPAGGFTAVLLTGSGTAALEMAVTSVLSERGRLVVVANGVYGERVAAMAAAAHLPHTVVESDWLAPPDLAAVERALLQPDVEAVAVVHHETTTGLLNPVGQIGRLARERGK